MTRPSITIGLPVFNGEKFLGRALDSLLGQTMENFELIITDNASVDATEQMCRDYARRDRRIRYYRNADNIGGPRNFNHVFALSDTKYFKWATADDFCGPEFLELALAVLEHDAEVVLCYAKTTTVAGDGSRLSDYEDRLHLTADSARQRFTRLVTTIGLCHQHQGLMRSSALRKTRLLRDHLGSDLNLLAELALYGKFCELPQRLFFRRFHEDASSWARDDMARQLAFYDPAGRFQIGLHGWRRYAADLDAIWRSEIGRGERMALYGFVLHRMIWDRRRLAGEIGRKARMLVGGTRPRPSARDRVESTR